jgi:hypothetical protein
MMKTFGILMIAVGEWHRRAARGALESILRWNDTPIRLLTDCPAEFLRFGAAVETVKVAPYESALDCRKFKVLGFWHSPFEKTLMLDADITVHRSLDPLFRLELTAVIAAALDPKPRMGMVGNLHEEALLWVGRNGVDCLHWNTGVLRWDRTAEAEILWEHYRDAWDRSSAVTPQPDQPAFFIALCMTGIKPQLLGPEWNYCGDPIAIQHHTQPLKVSQLCKS